jgi:HEAT repeat protein
LARIGALTGEELRGALCDPDAGVRRRACEVAARLVVSTGTALANVDGRQSTSIAEGHDLAAAVRRCLQDPSAQVCEAACYSLGERPGPQIGATVRALSAVAGEHPEPLCREAAVAALGAIGDPLGLQAVVAGLSDKLAVRRRAAVALAAFDGPVAQEALRSAASSRDWQTRQIAEDLLEDRTNPA